MKIRYRTVMERYWYNRIRLELQFLRSLGRNETHA